MNNSSSIFLALGSNLGQRENNLRQALEKLRSRGVTILKLSSTYQTEPLEVPDQPRFLNLVCEVGTHLQPAALLQLCQDVENTLGRIRGRPKGPRTIDIDILFYGRHVLDRPELTLPHPALHRRRFVLVPLEEIAPDFVDPRSGKTVRQLNSACTDRSDVIRWGGPS